jgi:hypothetical protein
MKRDSLDRLVARYRFWAMAASGAFAVFVFLLVIVYRAEKLNLFMLFLALLSGFLWIGATSISRHFFVLLKNYLGCRVNLVEFLSTQFVVFLFPFAYRKVKNEAEAFRKRRGREKT